jgi:hypothetical protein
MVKNGRWAELRAKSPQKVPNKSLKVPKIPKKNIKKL